MTEHHGAPGPFETEAEARAAVRHITGSPAAAWKDGNLRLLEDAYRAAGAELGAYDHSVVVFLAGLLEPQMCGALAASIARAHRSLPRDQRDRPRYSDDGPGVAMEGGGMISGPSRWPPS